MNREEQVKAEITRVIQQMGDELSGYQVVLFGSRAKGTAREHSDFDVGILGNQKLPLRIFYALDDLFESIDTLYSIDWVDLNDTTEAFRTEAMKKVEVLYG